MPDSPAGTGDDDAPDSDDGPPDSDSGPPDNDSDGAPTGTTSPAGRRRGATSESRPPADSRWWYWVAAVPVFYVVGTVVGFVFGVVAFALALTGVATVDPGIAPRATVGLGFASVFVVVMLLAAVGMLLTLLFPVAIYLDADAVAATAGDWDPDPVLYGLLGLAGIVAAPLQAPLAVYYLYRRHQSEGVP